MDDASLDDFLDGDESDDGAVTSPDGTDADEAATTGDEDADAAGGGTESEAAPDTDADAPTGGGGETDSAVAESGPAAGGDDGTEEEDGGRVDPAAVDPATTTYAWSPGGATCAECGAETGRRWQQDGQLVCPDCKAW